MDTLTLERPALPSSPAESALNPTLQNYVRTCVLERLKGEPAVQFDIHLYLALGDQDSAETLCRDLRLLGFGSKPAHGLIALFGQVADDLDAPAALARQLRLMHAHDKRLQLLASPQLAEEGRLPLAVGTRRYQVLSMHGDAHRLCRVMPCPVVVFTPWN